MIVDDDDNDNDDDVNDDDVNDGDDDDDDDSILQSFRHILILYDNDHHCYLL